MLPVPGGSADGYGKAAVGAGERDQCALASYQLLGFRFYLVLQHDGVGICITTFRRLRCVSKLVLAFCLSSLFFLPGFLSVVTS